VSPRISLFVGRTALPGGQTRFPCRSLINASLRNHRIPAPGGQARFACRSLWPGPFSVQILGNSPKPGCVRILGADHRVKLSTSRPACFMQPSTGKWCPIKSTSLVEVVLLCLGFASKPSSVCFAGALLLLVAVSMLLVCCSVAPVAGLVLLVAAFAPSCCSRASGCWLSASGCCSDVLPEDKCAASFSTPQRQVKPGTAQLVLPSST
jgi:hypothetical protein